MSMNRGQVSKLHYDTIKRVIETSQVRASVRPFFQGKLTTSRIAQLIKGSPLNPTVNVPVNEFIKGNSEFLVGFVQVIDRDNAVKLTQSDKATITVNLN